MADIVVCGGSVIGLATAMLLARAGHDVTVLERDGADVPASVDEAWERWERPAVPQFHQPHNLFPGYCRVLQADLPDIVTDLVAAGGTWVDFLDNMPPFISDRSPRDNDEQFRFVTGRRPMVELVHARVAANEPHVTVRRGTKVHGFLTRPNSDGVAHVTGVATSDGELRADLVVDAMGRRSPAAEWLVAQGARPPIVNAEDGRYTYYTVYFRGDQPVRLTPPGCPIGTFMILTIPGDNSTWSVTLWAPTDDPALRQFRDADKFDAVVRACPLHAHWLDGAALTPVLPMGGILDRYHRFVVDGRPVATGFAAVGDAWACTNPSAGRGLSVGLMQAQRLRDVVQSSLGDTYDFATEWDAVTEAELAPWYWNQLAADQARVAEMRAVREGRADSITTSTPTPPEFEPAVRAAPFDADVFRALLETIGCLALPQDVFARPGLWDKVLAAVPDEPFVFPGPTRDELLALLA